MNYICADGRLIPADQPVLPAANRGYRYGDGLFETMKVVDGRICLDTYHFSRFFAGLRQLQFVVPPHLDALLLTRQVLGLCAKNDCSRLGRARLSASRGNGGLSGHDDNFQYIIECQPLPPAANSLNEAGLVTGIFPGAQKACDTLANLKSANYLPSVMGARYARDNRWDDCFLLNQYGRVAESTIANIFWIKDGTLYTTPLSEGCVQGVMRNYLLTSLVSAAYHLKEQPVGPEELLQADELFLTNAIQGIRWVKQFGDRQYTNLQTVEIYNRFVQPVFG